MQRKKNLRSKKSTRAPGRRMCSVRYTFVNMGLEREPRLEKQVDPLGLAANKKPYQKPAFRYERVFETSALSCSKLPGAMRCGTKNNKHS